MSEHNNTRHKTKTKKKIRSVDEATEMNSSKKDNVRHSQSAVTYGRVNSISLTHSHTRPLKTPKSMSRSSLSRGGKQQSPSKDKTKHRHKRESKNSDGSKQKKRSKHKNKYEGKSKACQSKTPKQKQISCSSSNSINTNGNNDDEGNDGRRCIALQKVFHNFIRHPVTSDLWSVLISSRSLEILFIVIFGNSVILLIIALFSEEIGIKWPFKVTPVNSVTFQLANVFLLISYMCTNILWLRIVLTLATTFLMVWAGTFPFGKMVDVFMWNMVMMLINLRHSIVLLSQRRPAQFDRPEHEHIYVEMFQGIMSRADFKTLCAPSLIRRLRKVHFFLLKKKKKKK
ncbi:hypothetical protein RFI_14355 [Reticulomyxa filosa]|uniref:POPDC1-3 domain-containing protein n=1 Tax=Reticulomyxa filosa TaxID=46433 RepID=X6NBY8_RETFI|nr:hypothetical protein RFI_14355 [Reticulomyxa filosa]|eukprot:ETO22837.1 hypothetical protein RFI_14355 [Reticulomyxa filosa]